MGDNLIEECKVLRRRRNGIEGLGDKELEYYLAPIGAYQNVVLLMQS